MNNNNNKKFDNSYNVYVYKRRRYKIIIRCPSLSISEEKRLFIHSAYERIYLRDVWYYI